MTKFFPLFWVAPLLLFGCARPPAPEASASGPIRAISCGYAGLAAGQGRGFVLYEDGRVEQWEGRTPGADTRLLGRADTVAVHALWDAVAQARLASRSEQAVGTTAAYLGIDTAGGTHQISWPLGPHAAPVDSTLSGLFARCEQVALSAR